MILSDHKEILKWNEEQRRFVMEFALKNAEDYFCEDSVYYYARFDQNFFQPLVAEFNQTFSTRATSRTLAVCFRNLKDGYLYYDKKLVEFPGLGWYDVEKAMVINSHTYRSRFEHDVKKYPGLKGWVWGSDAFLACPYIDEIESLETLVGDYCEEWLSGESDDSYFSSDDDSYNSENSEDSMSSYTWERPENPTHLGYTRNQLKPLAADKHYPPNTAANFIPTIPSRSDRNFTQTILQTGLTSHTFASTGIGESKPSSSSDVEIMVTRPTNRDKIADLSDDIEILGIEQKTTTAHCGDGTSRKRTFENRTNDKRNYKRHNSNKGTSKDNPIDLF